MPTLYLIDGSGYIFRAYFAIQQPMTNPQGVRVQAVYGFMNMMLRLLQDEKPEYIAVVNDVSRVTFRNRIYDQYKAHRPPPPEDLIPQFALVRDATDALSIPRVEMEDYEADDLIASYARLARSSGMDVVIVSSDKDLMQLIGEGVSMYDPAKQKRIGVGEVLEKFGVGPDRVCDVLALMGDSSDNVPGVPGIGPKTAAELIVRFGSLNEMLENVGEIPQPKRREAIVSNAEAARLSYQLVCLKDDVPVPLSIDQLKAREPDPAALGSFLEAQGFKSLLLRLKDKLGHATAHAASPAAPSAIHHPPSTTYELVQDEASLLRWVAEAKARGIVAVDTETTGLDATRAELVGVSLATAAGKACYIPVGHMQGADLFAERVKGQIALDTVIAALKPLLEDQSVLKLGQNIKYDMLIFARYGIVLKAYDDTMLLSYVMNAGLHPQNMDELAERYLQHKTISYDEVTGTGRARLSFAEVGLDKARDYAAEDADVTFRLWEVFKPRVAAEKLLTLYETIERPLVTVLALMEAKGVRVDVGVLSGLSREFETKMAALEKEIHALAGENFNIGSPKQLGDIMFDKLQLPGGKKSGKTGAYTTDSGVLEELAEEGHIMPAKVIEWRQLAKLKGTYTDALANQINPETGRVHTSYAMAIASTGRLSSSDPNLQNIPIRTQEGRKIRTAFVASPGCKLISADYSQIELRLLAHVAEIEPLKAAFRNGDDIHAITASQMFGVPVAEVSADLRRSAKTINFGIIYGISAHGLATRLGIGRSEAATYIDQYFGQYPGIRDYMEATKELAHRQGYVTTLYGRRCYVPGINDKNGARRQFSERAAINAPLQGTAADIIKRAMIDIDRKLAASPLKAQMLLQVHDELVFEVPEAEGDQTLKLIIPAMEGAASLSVPLTVEAGVGDNWGEIH